MVLKIFLIHSFIKIDNFRSWPWGRVWKSESERSLGPWVCTINLSSGNIWIKQHPCITVWQALLCTSWHSRVQFHRLFETLLYHRKHEHFWIVTVNSFKTTPVNSLPFILHWLEESASRYSDNGKRLWSYSFLTLSLVTNSALELATPITYEGIMKWRLLLFDLQLPDPNIL